MTAPTPEEVAAPWLSGCCADQTPQSFGDIEAQKMDRAVLAVARAAMLSALQGLDSLLDVEVEYNETCPLCKKSNHPAMARRYNGHCSDTCDALATLDRIEVALDARIRELEVK